MGFHSPSLMEQILTLSMSTMKIKTQVLCLEEANLFSSLPILHVLSEMNKENCISLNRIIEAFPGGGQER